MKQRTRRIASPVLVAATVGGIFWVSAGDLNPPPGAVTPTMKTLVEVEPRIAINATNTPGDAASTFKITQPGSYYLTGNITGVSGKSGIVITSGQVTLDLNGFTLEGVRGTIAIDLQCVPDVVIRNGFISNWAEIGILGEDSTGLRIENIHMRNFPGCTVLVGAGTVVLDSSISDSSDGYQLGPRSRVERCDVRGCSGTAIQASTGSLVADCTLNDNGGGISLSGDGSVARNNVIKSSSNGVGISVGGISGRNNRIEGNHVTGGRIGLRILTIGNYVAGNTVMVSTDNYDFAQGNQLNILLGEIPESIDWPATVTLAGTLTGVLDTDGLTITADDVTVNLAGHALIGADGSTLGSGILMSGQNNVEIRNGTVRNFGRSGIREGLAAGKAHRVIDVRVVSNGESGISLRGKGHFVKGCTAEGNVVHGIIVGEFGTTITGSTVTNNTASRNGDQGIWIGAGSLVAGNTTTENFHGILTARGCTVTRNNASFNLGYGFNIGDNSLVDLNTAFGNNQGTGSLNMVCNSPCTLGLNHAP